MVKHLQVQLAESKTLGEVHVVVQAVHWQVVESWYCPAEQVVVGHLQVQVAESKTLGEVHVVEHVLLDAAH